MALISTWDELLASALVIRRSTMQLDERYALIGHYENGDLVRGSGGVWFFSDVYEIPHTVHDPAVPPPAPVFRRGEPVVTAVVGRPINTNNRPARRSAVEFGLVDPNDAAENMKRKASWLCISFADLDKLTFTTRAAVAA